MSRTSEILLNLIESGYSPNDLKKSCLNVLDPFFESSSTIEKFWTSNDLLSAFVFTIRYHDDDIFTCGLLEVLRCYRESIKKNRDLALKTISETLFQFSQKENMMFSVQRNVDNIMNSDKFEYAMLLIKHIGEVLEIGTKHFARELWAMIRIEDGAIPDYERINVLDFGVVIQNILDRKRFTSILKIEPLSIKLSDWRNIAYHHNYNIVDDTITCYYGKSMSSFTTTIKGLEEYVHKIVRSSNILSIAHSIIILENLDFIVREGDRVKDASSIYLREDLLNESLRVGLLSQSFLLEKVVITTESASISIIDLQCNNVDDDKDKKRRIHSSQLLYEVWQLYDKPRVEVKYSTLQNRECFISSVDASVCEKIGRGDEQISYLAEHISFTIL